MRKIEIEIPEGERSAFGTNRMVTVRVIRFLAVLMSAGAKEDAEMTRDVLQGLPLEELGTLSLEMRVVSEHLGGVLADALDRTFVARAEREGMTQENAEERLLAWDGQREAWWSEGKLEALAGGAV